MNKRNVIFTSIILIGMVSMKNLSAQNIGTETITAKDGKSIVFYFIKHGSVCFIYDSIVFYVDPVSYPNIDYGQMPKANYILVTHDHYDHFDTNAIEMLSTPRTTIIGNKEVKNKLNRRCKAMENYEQVIASNVFIKAMPAYNTTPGREMYHPKDRDNGYLINVGGTYIYFAGDCEDMVEMETIGSIDVAFLPVNQPYTMTVEQAINAAEKINPKIFFPYHYGDTDLTGLEVLNEKGIKVIIKPM
ncbi:MAG: MBL fold metallo-hydrolase [Lentimicrobiaceae bacterium]|nr:MBL fold metallo-hydrolase [Lentimicrobiaceae bacterium]